MDSFEYYTYLATRISPSDLAKAAARRCIQKASQVLAKPLPSLEDLLEAFCSEDMNDLALKLSSPRASSLWADASKREEISLAGQVLPGFRGKIEARATNAWSRTFDLFGKVVSFGKNADGIDWHFDFLNEGVFDKNAEGRDSSVWSKGLDPKAPWALARMEQSLALAQGVWITKSEEKRAAFAHEFTLQVRHFAAHNPFGKGVNWTCSMEVALRAMNLTLAYLMMRHRPELQDPEFAIIFVLLMAIQGKFVEQNLENCAPIPNNHYLADLVGLFHLGIVFPELPGAIRWRERAAEEIQRLMFCQVREDGFSFEGSTSYHRLVLELFTLAYFAAQASRIDFGNKWKERLHSMFRAVRTYLSPSGHAPQIGDNDSGRAIALSDRVVLFHEYLLPLGAALFLDPELKPEGISYSEEALFLMGKPGLKRFQSLPECGPLQSTSLPKSGLYFLRSGGAYCAISCGPNGQAGIGGHSHNDKLGVEIHYGQRKLVVDPGTYCYISYPDIRNYFRSTTAHSTVQVGELEQNRICQERLFALPDDARARALVFSSSPKRERFVGEHRGYQRFFKGMSHCRSVVWEKDLQGFVITDRIDGEGIHHIVSRFHLPDEKVRLRKIAEQELCRIQAANIGYPIGEQVVELGPSSWPRAILCVSTGAKVSLEPAWYSPGYGVRRLSLCVRVCVIGQLPIELNAVIL